MGAALLVLAALAGVLVVMGKGMGTPKPVTPAPGGTGGVVPLPPPQPAPGGVVPAGGGGTGVLPAGAPATFRTLTLEEFKAVAPDAQTYVDDAPPPHGLENGEQLILILTSGNAASWMPAFAQVTSSDVNASRGYAIAQVTGTRPGGAPVGTMFNLATATSQAYPNGEDDAYLSSTSPGVQDWLAGKGFAPSGINT